MIKQTIKSPFIRNTIRLGLGTLSGIATGVVVFKTVSYIQELRNAAKERKLAFMRANAGHP
jgi:hypothetical protein